MVAHPGQVSSSGGTGTNREQQKLASDRRCEKKRNFNDPETSLAGLEQRNATDASLQMEDNPPTTTTSTLLKCYCITHENIFQFPVRADDGLIYGLLHLSPPHWSDPDEQILMTFGSVSFSFLSPHSRDLLAASVNLFLFSFSCLRSSM